MIPIRQGSKHRAAVAFVAVLWMVGLCVAGCGSGQSVSGASGSGGSITIAAGSPPTSADQGLDFTTYGTELYSVVNTPLLAYVRGVQGAAGSRIIPALASKLPKVSDGATTYTFRLRKGLHYSNGQPVLASDETYALERDLMIPWQAASFISGFIKGATAYANGKAKTISGIATNDSTRTIVVHLTQPFAPIINVFALSGTAPVPKSTPMSNQASRGTIGDGPYKWGRIEPGHTYTLVRNTKFDDSGLPRGHAHKIVFNVNSNVLADAEAVLRNQQDVFDPTETLPGSIVGEVKADASSRYQAVSSDATSYFFFGVNRKPFSNIYARKAVLAALDLRALSRLDSGFIKEDCHLLPSGIPGHTDPASCAALTGHDPNGRPNMAVAKADMKKSGMIGQPVTVWGSEQSPIRQYVDYYTTVLNSLGFRTTEKIVSPGVYFATIGASTTKPQTGWDEWVQDFPDPWDFMHLFTCEAGSTLNYGYVCDKHLDSTVKALDIKPLTGRAGQWSALDRYAVAHAYYAAHGHQEFPKFYSSRLVFSRGVLSVEYQTDLTSLELNK